MAEPRRHRTTEGSEHDASIDFEAGVHTHEVNAFKPPKLRIAHEAGTNMAEERISSYRREFCLPETSEFCGHFLCTQAKGAILRKGHMLVFSNCIVFKSNVFGHYQRITIGFKDVTNIRKRTFLKLPNTIVVTRREGTGRTDEVFTAFNFSSRQTAYRVLLEQWMRVNPTAAAQVAGLAVEGDDAVGAPGGLLPGGSSAGSHTASKTLPCHQQPLSAYQPPGEDMTLVAEMQYPGADLESFVEFLLSDASGFYPTVVKSEGHDPRSISSWVEAPSLHAGVTSTAKRTLEYMYVSRGPWGDVKCLSSVEQQATLFEGGRLVMENQQRMPDLPVVGKAFYVAFRWEIQQTAGSDGPRRSSTPVSAGPAAAAAAAGAGPQPWPLTPRCSTDGVSAGHKQGADGEVGRPYSSAAAAVAPVSPCSAVDAPETPVSGGQHGWGTLPRRSRGADTPHSQSDAVELSPPSAISLTQGSGSAGLAEALSKASRGLGSAFKSMGSDLRGGIKSTTAAMSPGAVTKTKPMTVQQMKGSKRFRELMKSLSRSSKKQGSGRHGTSSLLSSPYMDDPAWVVGDASSTSVAAAASSTSTAAPAGSEVLTRQNSKEQQQQQGSMEVWGAASPSHRRGEDAEVTTGRLMLSQRHSAPSGLLATMGASSSSRSMASFSSQADGLPSPPAAAAEGSQGPTASSGSEAAGMSPRAAEVAMLSRISPSPLSATSKMSMGSILSNLRRASDASSRHSSDPVSDKSVSAATSAARAAGSAHGSSDSAPSDLEVMLPADVSLNHWQQRQQQGTALSPPSGLSSASGVAAAVAAPGSDASCSLQPSRAATPAADAAAACATTTSSSPATHGASSCEGGSAGAAPAGTSVTVKIYLAVRFASKYHPLRSKVEKGTFDTATGTYKQMLQLAGEWLRDPAKRCTMAAAMPHQAPVRGRHRRANSMTHRRTNSMLQRSSTAGARGRSSTEEVAASGPGAAAGAKPRGAVAAVMTQLVQAVAGGAHTAGGALLRVQLKEVLLAGLLVVGILQLLAWGQLLVLLKQLLEVMQQQQQQQLQLQQPPGA